MERRSKTPPTFILPNGAQIVPAAVCINDLLVTFLVLWFHCVSPPNAENRPGILPRVLEAELLSLTSIACKNSYCQPFVDIFIILINSFSGLANLANRTGTPPSLETGSYKSRFVYCLELAFGTFSLTKDWVRVDDSKQ